MKIAVPMNGETVEGHFGQCEMYTIATIDENNQLIKSELLPAPVGCGCKSDIAATLGKMGVEVMLAGNMGQGAVNTLSTHGIRVIRGNSGKISEVIDNYLKGKLVDSGVSCSSHEHHHEHNHEHNHEHGEGHSCGHNQN